MPDYGRSLANMQTCSCQGVLWFCKTMCTELTGSQLIYSKPAKTKHPHFPGHIKDLWNRTSFIWPLHCSWPLHCLAVCLSHFITDRMPGLSDDWSVTFSASHSREKTTTPHTVSSFTSHPHSWDKGGTDFNQGTSKFLAFNVRRNSTQQVMMSLSPDKDSRSFKLLPVHPQLWILARKLQRWREMGSWLFFSLRYNCEDLLY